MPRLNLTDAMLRAHKPADARRDLADQQVRGLFVRTETSGELIFQVRKRIGGKRPRVTLGSYPALSLKQAREKAIAELAKLQEGRNPTAERRAAQVEAVAARSEPTVAARLTEWQNAKDREWSARHATEVHRICKRDILPRLGSRALNETTRADWTGLVIAKRKTAPAMASLLYRTASGFLNYCDAAGWNAPLLPRKGLATLAPAPDSRERVLTGAELRAVWHACDKLTPRQQALVRLLILTGARREEVAGLPMSEIDMEAGRWALPANRAKKKRGYTMPLGPLALAELKAAGSTIKGFSGFSKLKVALDSASGVHGWRFHDLRRTCRATLSKLGISREVAEAALNHVGGRTGVVGIYDRYDFADEIIVALTRWQDHVAALVSEPPVKTAKVVRLRA